MSIHSQKTPIDHVSWYICLFCSIQWSLLWHMLVSFALNTIFFCGTTRSVLFYKKIPHDFRQDLFFWVGKFLFCGMYGSLLWYISVFLWVILWDIRVSCVVYRGQCCGGKGFVFLAVCMGLFCGVYRSLLWVILQDMRVFCVVCQGHFCGGKGSLLRYVRVSFVGHDGHCCEWSWRI